MADSVSSVSDAELLTIVDGLKAALMTHAADYPMITAGMKSNLDTLRDLFNDKIAAHTIAQADAKAATAAKVATRDTVEKAVRDIRNLCKAGNVEYTKMAALGIPSGGEKLPAAATVPTALVDTSERLRHTISWKDAAANGNKRKPRGAMGAEIWLKIDGPAPGSEKDCTFLTLDSATPYLAEFEADDAGKTAHYMLRWRMQDGSVGAWGETISATVTA